MRKHSQNVIIDAVLFLCIIVLIGTGIIMRWVLPPGSHQKTIMAFTRHDWGDLHYWIALFFVVLLFIHLVLHFSWIKGSYWPSKKQKN